MKLSQFRYAMPKDLVALRPAKYRDEARLMVVHRDSGEIEHRIFKDITEYFEPKDVIVANNTKVMPSLLKGEKEKTGASITVFLLRELNETIPSAAAIGYVTEAEEKAIVIEE